jgi:nucleoside-diphosphate-sugar epimerase
MPTRYHLQKTSFRARCLRTVSLRWLRSIALEFTGATSVSPLCPSGTSPYTVRVRTRHGLYSRNRSCASSEPFEVFGDGNHTRDFTFVADAVNGTVAAAQFGVSGSAYNIGGGSRRSLNSVFETLAGLLRTPIERKYRDRQLGDARDTAADIRRARRDLGFEPSFDFDAGLKAQLDWQYAMLVSPEPLL